MLNYLLKRLLLIPVMMFGITLISFLAIQLSPGVSEAMSGQLELSADKQSQLAKQKRDVLKKIFHADKQVLLRYFYWLGDFLRGDFGQSVNDYREVSGEIWRALRVTLVMNVIVIFLIYVCSIPIGIYSATHQNSYVDCVLTLVLFALYSLPSFWVAVLLIRLMTSLKDTSWNFLSFPYVGIFPPGAESMPTLTLLWHMTAHMFLPILVLTYGGLAGLSRYMRVGMLDVIRSDYIRTARAKGLPESKVVLVHALRNSLIPVITLVAGLLPALIGGSFIIEVIFNIPGMGQLSYTAMLARDYTTLMAILTLSAFLTLIGILVSDILYVLVDPRITFESKG
jgi:peptide/nickel transport system permease protein